MRRRQLCLQSSFLHSGSTWKDRPPSPSRSWGRFWWRWGPRKRRHTWFSLPLLPTAAPPPRPSDHHSPSIPEVEGLSLLRPWSKSCPCCRSSFAGKGHPVYPPFSLQNSRNLWGTGTLAWGAVQDWLKSRGRRQSGSTSLNSGWAL